MLRGTTSIRPGSTLFAADHHGLCCKVRAFPVLFRNTYGGTFALIYTETFTIISSLSGFPCAYCSRRNG